MTQQLNQPQAIVVFDIDGVIRDVSGSYRRAISDTVEHFTNGAYRPSLLDIDYLKSEGVWNNDWEASQELIHRYFQKQQKQEESPIQYDAIVSFFQSRYRGPDPENWTGYICQEPLLVEPSYLEQLTTAGISWGFFSGATRGSATYVLERRLAISSPVLTAMEDAPGKPDPTGLLATVEQLEQRATATPVLYVGDTVADMFTVGKARSLFPSRTWIGVGVLPPHVLQTPGHGEVYADSLLAAGATAIFRNVQELTPVQIQQLTHLTTT